MRIFASQTSCDEIRRLSSAGGVFSILSENILKEGGLVYGAAFDPGWMVGHKRIDSANNLDEIRRSKYVFSDYIPSIKEALADLKEQKKVLFSGLPCQIAAIKRLAGDNPNLLCVEVVCHGAPNPKYWNKYLSELCDSLKYDKCDISDINFRDKRTGWKNYSFTIKFKDGAEFTQTHGQNLYMRGFLADYILREPCFNCRFKYPSGSQADITLGDLWGISEIAPDIDNDKGTTLVIAQTKIGTDACENLERLESISLDIATRYNPAITTSATKPADYEIFKEQFDSSSNFLNLLRKQTKISKTQRAKRFISRLFRKFTTI